MVKSKADSSSKGGISTTSLCASVTSSVDELSKEDVNILVWNLPFYIQPQLIVAMMMKRRNF